MMRLVQYGVTFLLLLVLQEFVFSHINLGGVVNPYIYIMFIILLPLDIAGWGLLLLGFGTGMAMDFLSGTAGLHTIVSTWLAFVRPTTVGLLLGKDETYQGGIPTSSRLGLGRFLRYLSVMVLLFNIPFFLLEDLGGPVVPMVLRILLSSVFSIGIIYFLHLPFAHTRWKI